MEQVSTYTKDIVLVLGLPVPNSREELRQFQRERKSLFWEAMGWRRCREQFDQPVRGLVRMAKVVGCQVIQSATRENYRECVQKGVYGVVILFTHGEAGVVEFSDGMLSDQDLCGLVPKDFAGIVDLSVCKSDKIVERFRKTHPMVSLGRVPKRGLLISLWANFYRNVLEEVHVREGRDPYTRIVSEVRNKYLDSFC